MENSIDDVNPIPVLIFLAVFFAIWLNWPAKAFVDTEIDSTNLAEALYYNEDFMLETSIDVVAEKISKERMRKFSENQEKIDFLDKKIESIPKGVLSDILKSKRKVLEEKNFSLEFKHENLILKKGKHEYGRILEETIHEEIFEIKKNGILFSEENGIARIFYKDYLYSINIKNNHLEKADPSPEEIEKIEKIYKIKI